ncbi:hypothetical protein [Flavobacterium solisilvae]|uniref:Uncharacterized protein n=1 Tax=Flavobacterium solisilvae TaxID=1852019 RepID=A0ABX1QRE2_9FLAO|nr:hypothetical protein [Flavobacterium solisilvae]NMH24401.1 hypothetical protein [Flavobacterium solisilvae]
MKNKNPYRENNYILTKNFESLGRYYLEIGLNFYKKTNYLNSSEYFKKALIFINCLNRKQIDSELEDFFFKDLNGTEDDELVFSLAFVSLFCTNNNEHWTLKYVDIYLKSNEDFFGNLLKTIALHQLEDDYNLKISYEKTIKFQEEHTFLKYLSAKIKKSNGIKYIQIIHQNFVENYTDYNSLLYLYEMYKKIDNPNYLILDEEKLNNILINYFYYKSANISNFISFYINVVDMQINKDGLINYPIVNLIKDFTKMIDQNRDFFIEVENSTNSFYHVKIMDEENKLNDLLNEHEVASYEYERENDYYNENLDLDQQDPDFWDNF